MWSQEVYNESECMDSDYCGDGFVLLVSGYFVGATMTPIDTIQDQRRRLTNARRALRAVSAVAITSLFFNAVQIAVLTDNEAEIDQLNYAVQHIACEQLKTEDKIAKGLCLEKLW